MSFKAALPAAVISLAALIAAPHAAAAGPEVTYQVDSDGLLLSVTYTDGVDNEEQVTNVPAPWTMTFTDQATYPMYGVAAQTRGSQVSCQIIVNGQVRDQKSATGRYSVVDCDAA